MADSTLNRFVSSGTTAERTAFTPTPPSPASGPDPGYTWFDTDLTTLYAWDGAAWQPATVAGAGTVTNTGTLTANALIIGNGGVDVSALGSLGTTTTVLHGNAAGAPTFGAVTLTTDVTGTLPIANGGTGQAAATAAFDALAPTTTAGDVIYSNGSDNVRLGIGTAGQVLTTNAGATAPEWAAPAAGGGELAYVEFTSPVTITATVEGSADTLVTAGSLAFDGSTVVMIEFFTPRSQPGATANSQLIYNLFEDGSDIGRIAQQQNAASGQVSIFAVRRMTPSNASHDYSVRAWRTVSNGTVTVGAGGAGVTMPGYIRITTVS